MKNVKLTKSFTYQVPNKSGLLVHYGTVGKEYKNVPEAHADAMIESECGEVIVETDAYEPDELDNDDYQLNDYEG